MKVVNKYVLIEPKKEGPKKTESGFELGDSHREDIRYREAVVVQASEEVEGLNPGAVIYYDRHAGFDLEVDGKVYRVIKVFDVVVVL